MFSGNDSLPTAVLTTKERDLQPLLRESSVTLGLDAHQVTEIEVHLHEAWFLGVKMGQRVMLETRMGESDQMPIIVSMQDEFQDLMERLAEALNLSVPATIAAWNYLCDARIAGAKFWEVEIVARLIESESDDVEEWLRRLGG
jgi:hypothetical protein